jgi:xylulokinase
MSLLGIDAGTTGCKAAAFSLDGRILGSAYREYDVARPQPGWAELDTAAVWRHVRDAISEAAAGTAGDPVSALAVSSLGEAVVPVTLDRRILGPSLLNFDARGAEFLDELRADFEDSFLYGINGNTLGNHYTLTKLAWIRRHQPEMYARADRFLHWSSFVAFMLGADPVVDYSLANRTLLFDVGRGTWSSELLARASLDRDKLPEVAPSGTVVGRMPAAVASGLGLPPGVAIVTGAHDQCANAVGCGVIEEGTAVYGMGTYICITPVFTQRRDPALMIERGLNTEHHAVPGRFVSFIYNQGGVLFKWFRDNLAAAERRPGVDSYAALIAEMPAGPSSVVVRPHFAPTGPPRFVSDSCGVISGLRLDTSRGDILKGILESTTFYLKQCVDSLPPTGIRIDEYRAAGGGSKSDTWVQLCADILGRPLVRPAVTEAGALGAAIIAGVGSRVFPDYSSAVASMVKLDRTFAPSASYEANYTRYKHFLHSLQHF